MKYLIRTSMFFWGLLFVWSCSDDSDSPDIDTTPSNQVSSVVKVFPEEAIKYLAEEVSANEVVLDLNIPENLIPKVGTIIQIPMSEKSPYGFLGKVVSIEKNSGYRIVTETVALDEAYPNLSIDTIFNFLNILDGVYDGEGNPVEYEIEWEDTKTKSRVTAEIGDDKIGKIKVPIKNEKLGDFTIGGYLSFDLGMGDFRINNKDGLKYLNIEATPSIDANVQMGVTLKEWELNSIRSKPVRLTGRFMPVPGVIVSVTVSANFVIGAKGEISTATALQFQKSSHWFVRYENGQWSKGVEPTGKFDGNPWYVTQLDLNGELYGGVECGIDFSLYEGTLGIGAQLLPKFSLATEASLSSLNPFEVNPKVSIGGKLESSIYCIAGLFGKNLAKWEWELPEATFFERSLSLFPNIENFTATGASSSGEISWQNDSYYFLQGLGVKTGTTVFQPDQTTVFNTYYPAHTSIDANGIRYYKVDVTGLQPGSTYYAAPVISWLDYKWIGKQEAFLQINSNLLIGQWELIHSSGWERGYGFWDEIWGDTPSKFYAVFGENHEFCSWYSNYDEISGMERGTWSISGDTLITVEDNHGRDEGVIKELTSSRLVLFYSSVKEGTVVEEFTTSTYRKVK